MDSLDSQSSLIESKLKSVTTVRYRLDVSGNSRGILIYVRNSLLSKSQGLIGTPPDIMFGQLGLMLENKGFPNSVAAVRARSAPRSCRIGKFSAKIMA